MDATDSPRGWVYALFGIEAVFPGLLLGLLGRAGRRRPKPTLTARPWPVARIAALVVLLVVLAGVAGMSLQQGFLTGESALAAVRYMLRFTVLPIFLFTLLWRRRKRPNPAA